MPVTLYLLFATTNLNPPEIQSLIKNGLEFAYIENFDSARIYFQKIIEFYPENPAGYFFSAALLQLKMMDQCHNNEEKEYLKLIKVAREKSKMVLEKGENLWAEFYLGSSYGYQAVYEGMKGNYLETFKFGIKGGRMLEEIIKKEPQFYDAYLGAGTYEYFWARASRYLPFLKLTDGDVNEAIKKMHIAAEKSLYMGPTARNSLSFIYGEEGKYENATLIIDSLLKEYPTSRTFHWNKANLEFKKKNYPVALKIYEYLFSIYNDEENHSNLAQCKLYIGKCYLEMQEKEKAKTALKEVIGYKVHEKRYPKIKEYVRQAYALLGRLVKL